MERQKKLLLLTSNYKEKEMRLVRFTVWDAKNWDETFAINPEHVVHVEPARECTHISTVNGKIYSAQEGYDTVCNLLTGSF